MVDDGATYATVEKKLGIAPSTMTGVMNRRERYLTQSVTQ